MSRSELDVFKIFPGLGQSLFAMVKKIPEKSQLKEDRFSLVFGVRGFNPPQLAPFLLGQGKTETLCEQLPPTRPQLPVAVIIHSPLNCTTSWGPRPLGAPSYPSHIQTELHIHDTVSLRHILLIIYLPLPFNPISYLSTPHANPF